MTTLTDELQAWLLEHALYSIESVCFNDLQEACDEARKATIVTGRYWSVYSSDFSSWMLSAE